MHRALAALLLCCSATHAAPAQRLAKPVTDTVNHHIVRVMNSGPSAWADTNGWKLVYERTVQPPDGSPGMLEKVRGIVLLRDNRLLVAQGGPAAIRLYDAEGKFVRNIGRDGDGPGEYRSATIAVYHDTVAVHDGRTGRATLLSLDGKPVRTFLTGIHFDGPPVAVDDRGRLRVLNSRTVAGERLDQWVYFDLTGKRLDSLLIPVAVKPKTWVLRDSISVSTTFVPFAPQTLTAPLADGSFVYGATDRYELVVTRSGTDSARIFGRGGVTADRIPPAQRDSFFAGATRDPRMRRIASMSDVPATYSLWENLFVDGHGNVWTITGHASAHNRRFDVFTPAGAYLGAVALPFTSFNGVSWNDDHVAILDRDDDELPRVRIYRIDRRGH